MHPKWAVLTPGGELETREGKHTLEDLQQAVGGSIEHLRGPHGEDIFINEDGKYEHLRHNVGATEYMHKYGRIGYGDYIAGTMVFTGISARSWVKLREEFPEGHFQVAPGLTIVRVEHE